MKKFLGLWAILFLILLTSCGQKPYNTPEFKDIGSNQTAFLIPMVGDTQGQTKFASVDYLKAQQVGAKRVQIPKEWVQTGRNDWEGTWRPTHLLVLVDRTPVSVTWLSTSGDLKIGVESLESTGFSVGVSLTAGITEEAAATFLYWYPSMSLKDVVNQNVNPYVKSQFALEFGKLRIDDVKLNKGKIFTDVEKRTQDFFAKYGITISQLGFTEGLVYDDPKLQAAMDEQTRLVIENANKLQEKKNAEVQNQIDVAKAQAQADAKAAQDKKNAEIDAYKAQIAAANLATQKSLMELEIRKTYAEASKIFAANFRPQVVSSDVLKQLNLNALMADPAMK